MKLVAWWALLAATALVAVFAQLDRASAARPQLAPLVPSPLRSAAQPAMTMLAVVRDPAFAQAEARRLVRRRPMPAEHLFALALADLRGGDVVGYASAFGRSTERGWRPAPVQQAAARAALAQGNFEAAANRVAALWALDAGDSSLPELTASLLASKRGRQAFAEALAGTRVWQDWYLQRAREFSSASDAREVVGAALRRGARFAPVILREFDRGTATESQPPLRAD